MKAKCTLFKRAFKGRSHDEKKAQDVKGDSKSSTILRFYPSNPIQFVITFDHYSLCLILDIDFNIGATLLNYRNPLFIHLNISKLIKFGTIEKYIEKSII